MFSVLFFLVISSWKKKLIKIENREELKTLQDERMRTEHLRDSIDKELVAAKEKAAKIEEVNSLARLIYIKKKQ